jgi:hypothetical protein
MRRQSIGFIAILAAQFAAAQTSLTPHQRLAREIYSELISINTTDSIGAVTPAVEAMAKRFRTAGFPESDIKVLIPPGKPNKGNLVVRYHGPRRTGEREADLALGTPRRGRRVAQ